MPEAGKHDELELAGNPKIQEMLKGQGEDPAVVLLSFTVDKINKKGSVQSRIILITDKALYNIVETKVQQGLYQRRVAIASLSHVIQYHPRPPFPEPRTDGDDMTQFVIKVRGEHDYHFRANRDTSDTIVDTMRSVFFNLPMEDKRSEKLPHYVVEKESELKEVKSTAKNDKKAAATDNQMLATLEAKEREQYEKIKEAKKMKSARDTRAKKLQRDKLELEQQIYELALVHEKAVDYYEESQRQASDTLTEKDSLRHQLEDTEEMCRKLRQDLDDSQETIQELRLMQEKELYRLHRQMEEKSRDLESGPMTERERADLSREERNRLRTAELTAAVRNRNTGAERELAKQRLHMQIYGDTSGYEGHTIAKLKDEHGDKIREFQDALRQTRQQNEEERLRNEALETELMDIRRAIKDKKNLLRKYFA